LTTNLFSLHGLDTEQTPLLLLVTAYSANDTIKEPAPKALTTSIVVSITHIISINFALSANALMKI
jgi:hypothetical protein